jgi:hypothetical protein
LLFSPIAAGGKGELAWEQWQRVAGVFDVTGPLPGGALLLATGRGLFELSPGGALSPVSAGYTPSAGAEAYIALSSGLAVPGAGCSFPDHTVYLLQTAAPPAVLADDLASGVISTLAPIAGVDTLSGIAFDRSGRFGDRLLVIGPHSGATVVDAIDCRGRVTPVTTSAPRMEGGMAVAPPTFGAYGGDLVVPDELSGNIIAVTAEGTTLVIARAGPPIGPDVGAESAGFVPTGFFGGGWAYLADRATAGNAHPGTDTLLRLSAAALRDQGVAEGDLLVAGEGGGATIAVHCAADGSCSGARRIGLASEQAHVEGHLLLVADRPGTSPRRLPEGRLGAAGRGGVFLYLPYAVGIVLLAGLYLLYRRRSRPR